MLISWLIRNWIAAQQQHQINHPLIYYLSLGSYDYLKHQYADDDVDVSLEHVRIIILYYTSYYSFFMI